MIPEEVIREAKAMLDAGHRPKSVAQALDISEPTVRAIAKGKRKVHVSKIKPNKDGVYERAQGFCEVHGRIDLTPCVACAGERYRREHPEQEWVDAVPPMNERKTEVVIAALMRGIDRVAAEMGAVGSAAN